MEAMKTTILCALVVCMFMVTVVLTIDALEFEQTGSCRDCVLLTKIRPELRAPELIVGD